MTDLNYLAPAQLFLGRGRATAAALGPRAFKIAAKAIRFALEEVPPVSLRGARLEVGDSVFAGKDLARLYRSQRYPLARKPSHSAI